MSTTPKPCPRGDDVESIMSRTTVCGQPPPDKAASVVSSLTASVVSTSKRSAVGSVAAAPSVASSKATTTVTLALRQQIAGLEKQLDVERKEREEATKRIQDTQKELDALEKLLRINPV